MTEPFNRDELIASTFAQAMGWSGPEWPIEKREASRKMLALLAALEEAELELSFKRRSNARLAERYVEAERARQEAERRIAAVEEALIHPNRLDEYGETPLRWSIRKAYAALHPVAEKDAE